MTDLILAHGPQGWVMTRYGIPVWTWPTPGNPDAPVEAWVVREILEAFEEQQKIMDGMYDALGPAADDVMEMIVNNLRLELGG